MTTRREMLLTFGALALVPACSSSSGGTDAGPRADGGGRACASTTSTISSNHGHELTVPGADVAAGTSQTYDIQGTSGHAHSVTLGAADFTVLRSAGSVIVASTAGGGHMHMVTVRCA